MSQNFNDFCLYCTGNNRREIRQCEDINCPFHPFKYGGLEKDEERQLCKDILKDVGVIE